MKQGSKVELPLWLAEMLAVSNPSGNSSLATLDLPQALSQRVMNALKADPKTVDLRAQAQHFYNIGARMLELFEEEEMVDILTDVSFGIHDFFHHRSQTLTIDMGNTDIQTTCS
jgi:GINS complex subunit 3